MVIRLVNILKRCFSIVFLLSMFVTVSHHHDDLKVHNDCQICVLQSNVTNSDLPPQNVYLSDLTALFEIISTSPTIVYSQKPTTLLHQRAPPSNS